MDVTDLISPDAVFDNLKARSKKQALQELADAAARIVGIPSRDIFDVLLQRERLGSTGIGQGVAIPHGKLAKLDRIYGLFAHLKSPIDFDAVDDEPVDTVFLLLAPEGAGADHLKALARVSRLLRNGPTLQKLRNAHDRAALYAILTEPASSSHAA